jgi:hypothetical protein
LKLTASMAITRHRRKHRAAHWLASRDVLIACAGLLGTSLGPGLGHAEAALPPKSFDPSLTPRAEQIGAPLPDAFAKRDATKPPATLTLLNPDTEGLTALDLGRYRLADDVTSAPFAGTICLDLQQVLTALDFPIVVDKNTLQASGWFVREGQTVALDLAEGRARVGGLPIPMPPNGVAQLTTGPCMTLPALQKIFSLELDYNQNGSLVAINTAQPLPLVERLERQSRTKLRSLSYSASQAHKKAPAVPYRALVLPNSDIRVSFGGQKTAGVKASSDLSWSSLSVGEFAYMTAEAQFSGTQEGIIGDVSRLRLYRSEREGGVFGISKLTEVAVGDIPSSGASLGGGGGLGLGASFSTFPTNRPGSFDRTDFQGALPVGWDVELYRNGQLLEFANQGETGGYAFKDVPVLLGDNEFEIIMYGPQGQRRVISKRINAANFLAPKGAAYYRAAIYQSEPMFAKARGDSALRVDLQAAMGVTNNLNLGFAFNSYERNQKRASTTTLAAQTSLYGAAINSELAITELGALAGQIEFQGNRGIVGLRGRLVVAQEDFASERLSNAQLARLELGLDRRLNFKGISSGTISGQFRVEHFHNGAHTLTAKERMSLAIGNAFITQSLNWVKTSSGKRRDVIDGDLAYSRRQGRFSLRGSINYKISPDPEISRLNLVVERALAVSANAWRWRAEASWLAEEDKFNYGIGIVKNFHSYNLDMVANTDGRKNHSFNIGLSFSFGRKGPRWGLSARPLAQAGTIRAQLYEDLDEDGRFSSGDTPIKGAGVLSQSSFGTAVTNGRGVTYLSGLDVNEVAQVNVLTDDLEDETLYAQTAYATPREGAVSMVQIPLNQVGVVEGQVQMIAGFDSIASPLGGVTLSLLGRDDKEVARTVTAYDGYYSFETVPVGNYVVALASDTALATRVRPVVPVILATNRKSPDATGLTMTLIDKNPTRMPLRGLI